MAKSATTHRMEPPHRLIGRLLGNWNSRSLNREALLWAGVVLVALLVRLIGLGSRGMSHDESLHALYSYYLYSRGEYVHDPMMHGPLLFHTNALVYLLLGVSDFTTRLMPALAGTAVVGSMWWFRRYLGRTGALAAALLLTVSPALLFHSRYIRNDIYIVLASLVWMYMLFRYLESGGRRYLLGLAVAMALGVSSKENHFITGAIMGTFALTAAVAWTLNARFRQVGWHWRFWDLALFMALAVLPFLSPLVHGVLGWVAVDYTVEAMHRSALVAGTMGILSVAGGWLWFGFIKPRYHRDDLGFAWFLMAFAVFWIIALSLFSTFFTNPQGLISGPVGSLGYWLEQQAVQRGNQPWYYYLMLGSMYEFLPLTLAIAGAVLAIRRYGRQRQADLADGAGVAAWLVPMFLVWWCLASWMGYGYASERMPWLLTHIAAPMCLLGGWAAGRLLHGIRGESAHGWWFAVGVGGWTTCWLLALTRVPFAGRELESARHTMQWTAVMLLGLAAALLAFRSGRQIPRPSWPRMTALGLLVPMGLLTLTVTYNLNFVNYDYVVEYLVYAHASPDVKQSIREIRALSEELYGDGSIPIAYDHDNSWPMAWYFRDFPQAVIYDSASPAADTMAFPVVLAGPTSWNQVRPHMERDYLKRTYRLIWWPEESYKQWTASSIQGLFRSETRRQFFQVFFQRRHPTRDLRAWPHTREFEMYVRKDLAPLIWDEADPVPATAVVEAVPELEMAMDFPVVDTIAGVFHGLELNQPRSITVAPGGLRVVADSGNHRVLVLDRDHQVRLAVGTYCGMETADGAGCVDPDGPGPLEAGDGQLNEPWGAVLNAEGTLIVADTWNHRIQLFDGQGTPVRKWGGFGMGGSQAGDAYSLYGPRGLELDEAGALLVADTGNDRIVRYDLNGRWLGTVGGGGTAAGHFNEPVDVTRGQSGAIYVTDTWNRRIQIFSGVLEHQALFSTGPTVWSTVDVFDKPYLAEIPAWGLAVTDPLQARVVIYDFSGRVTGVITRPYAMQSHLDMLPIGVAYDPEARQLLVVDGNHNDILVFDVSGGGEDAAADDVDIPSASSGEEAENPARQAGSE